MSELSVDKITGKTGTGGSNSPLQFSGDTVTLDTGVTISSGATIGTGVSLANATFPAGHVIGFNNSYTTSAEVISLTTANTMYSSANLYLDYTPKITGSKLLVNANIKASHSSNAGTINAMRVMRTGPSTAYSIVGGDGSTWNTSDFVYLGGGINWININTLTTAWEDIAQDNTTAHRYIPQIGANVGSISGYINRRGSDAQWGVSSSIWVMEIAQ